MNLGQKSYPVSAILPALDKGETLRALTLHESSYGQSVSISLDRWSYRFLKLEALMDFPVRGEVLRNEQGLVIVVENMTSHLITACQAYYNGRFFSFGDIPPDRRIVKNLSDSALGEAETFQDGLLESITARAMLKRRSLLLKKIQKNLMKDLLLSTQYRYQSEPRIFHLFGWIETSVIPIHLADTSAVRQDVVLLEWEIPVKPDGESVKPGLVPEESLGDNDGSAIELAACGRQKAEAVMP
ncbi:MAG: hypothetical protein JRI34_08580 [Deltaproteobacteria bacterium]|nr:hypothetical protein [Deltaproteobacteria bacterium]